MSTVTITFFLNGTDKVEFVTNFSEERRTVKRQPVESAGDQIVRVTEAFSLHYDRVFTEVIGS